MERTIFQLWRLSIVGPIFIRFMWSGVCCMTTAVVRVKSKPPSTRSTVLLIYLYIFCKNWFGTIELSLDSIIDNDNWWEHVRGVCYYDCPQICWLLVSTSLNPSKKPRQDITMSARTGGNIITSNIFLTLFIGTSFYVFVPKIGCLKTLGWPKFFVICSTFDFHSALKWRVRYLFCPAHDKMYDDTGLVTGHCTALDEVPQIRR